MAESYDDDGTAEGEGLSAWMRNEALFFQELETGARYAVFVGIELMKRGFTVYVTPSSKREKVEDRHAWAEEVDLYVGRNCEREHQHKFGRLPMEVKSRDLDFTSAANYPHATALVDTKSGWAKKSPKPNAVILVSQVTKALLVVRSSTSGRWGELARIDRKRRIEDVWLTCPTEALQGWDDFCSDLSIYLGECRM